MHALLMHMTSEPVVQSKEHVDSVGLFPRLLVVL